MSKQLSSVNARESQMTTVAMTAAPNDIDVAIFREVLSTFPAGVVVVTALGEDGVPAGLTISAFSSVSVDPTLILVCVDRGSKSFDAIRTSKCFTVNILAAGRESLALKFASKGDDKYDGVTWKKPSLPDGGPILTDDAASFLLCKVDQEIEAGDHFIFIGEAVEAGVQFTHPPLLYHNRGFVELAAS